MELRLLESSAESGDLLDFFGSKESGGPKRIGEGGTASNSSDPTLLRPDEGSRRGEATVGSADFSRRQASTKRAAADLTACWPGEAKGSPASGQEPQKGGGASRGVSQGNPEGGRGIPTLPEAQAIRTGWERGSAGTSATATEPVCGAAGPYIGGVKWGRARATSTAG